MQGLALELKMLRLRAGNPSLEELARKMTCSHSTISAYLNGHRLPPPDQLSRFVRACGGDPAVWQRKLEEVHEQLTRLPAQGAGGSAQDDAAQKGWWEENADLPANYQQFIGMEQQATFIAIWNSDVVPDLLQTEAYARHAISSYGQVDPIAPGMIKRLVQVRMLRQQVLTRTWLALRAVLDESILIRRFGTDPVMYEQLQQLARESDRPNLTMQVLPLNARHQFPLASSVIFGFESDGEDVLRDVVSTEYSLNDYSFLEGERKTYLHRIAFHRLAEVSLSPGDSRQLILDIAESHWSR